MKPAVVLLLAAAAFAQPAVTTPPILVHKVSPHYTLAALTAKIEGVVVLYAEIGIDGRAHRLHVVQSLGAGLDEKAMQAVRQWRFQPGRKDGRAVTTASTIEVNFQLYGAQAPKHARRV